MWVEFEEEEEEEEEEEYFIGNTSIIVKSKIHLESIWFN